jgi:hypothetical protein
MMSTGERIDAAIKEARSARIRERILERDTSVWTTDPSVAKMINNSLGWLTVAEQMMGIVPELRQFAEEVRRQFRHVMGGL